MENVCRVYFFWRELRYESGIVLSISYPFQLWAHCWRAHLVGISPGLMAWEPPSKLKFCPLFRIVPERGSVPLNRSGRWRGRTGGRRRRRTRFVSLTDARQTDAGAPTRGTVLPTLCGFSYPRKLRWSWGRLRGPFPRVDSSRLCRKLSGILPGSSPHRAERGER